MGVAPDYFISNKPIMLVHINEGRVTLQRVYNDPTLTIACLARMVGVSEATLLRDFKRHLETTPQDSLSR